MRGSTATSFSTSDADNISSTVPRPAMSTVPGSATTSVARFSLSSGGNSARADSMLRLMSRALTAISTPLSLGLAIVSIIAAVFPKPLLNFIGPAPSGRLLLR